MPRVLVVDDEPSIRETLAEFLADAGYAVASAETVADARRLLAEEPYDVVVTDIILPHASGIQLLRELHATAPHIKVILITGEPTFATAADAVREGAFDYLPKPVTHAAITRVVGAAARVKAVEDENRLYRERLEALVAERTDQIRKYSARLRQMAERTRAFVRCTEIGDLAPQVLSLFAQNMLADGGSFYRRVDGGLELVASLEPGHQPKHIELPAPAGSVLAFALEHPEGLVVEDIAAHCELRPSGWDGYRDGSLLALPCVDGAGQVLEVVTLHNKRTPPFTPEDLDIARIIAAHVVESTRAIELNERLRGSEQKYRELAEGSLAAILLLQAGRIVYANPHAAVLLGRPQEEAPALLGLPFIELVHPEDRGWVGQQLAAPTAGRTVNGPWERRALRTDGATVWVLELATAAEHEGRPATLVHAIDVTDRKRAEDERAQLQAQFLQSQKMEAIGRLAGGVAHDFNNLLMAICGYADLLLARLPEADAMRRDVDEIRFAGERAAALTRQLLAFSRRQAPEPQVLTLNDVVNEARRLLGRIIGEDVRLEFRPDPALWSVSADPNQVDQILVNLATNARDAMPTGGSLTLETSNLPAADGRPASVLLVARDTGCGMDDATRAQVFEPFFSTKPRGTGLGLATVREIVAQHGGRVEIESQLGQGTTVRVSFPALPAESSRRRPIPSATISAPGRGETVLLVEDDPGVRRLTCDALERFGYEVIEARDAQEALHIDQRRAARVQLLLSDVVLPGMTGLQLAETLRQRHADLRVIFVSGYAEDVLERHGGVPSDAQLLPKPYSIADLARKVRETLDA
jgi:PAS domain S-box-containing protein